MTRHPLKDKLMNKHLLTWALASALAVPATGQAASFVGVATEGPVVIEDYSGDGLISFDIDFLAVTSATLSYRIGADDLGAMGLGFNAILRNLAGTGLGGYSFSLSTGSFDGTGSVTRTFGGDSQVTFNGGQATVSFSTPEFLDVEIGDPLGAGAGQTDWGIDGLAVGDRLSITVSAVPEPGSYALLLSGLGVMGWLVRRRRAA